MRFLLVNNHCITDPTAGVTQSLRTIMQWLAGAGHSSRILTTARFESPVTFTIEDHLTRLGVALPSVPGQDVVEYATNGLPVTLLLTRHTDERRPHRAESERFLEVFEELMDDFAPDQVIACNAHPMIRAALLKCRLRNVTTAFGVRGHGYHHPQYFENVDHVFTCSQYLTDVYRRKIGLVSTPLEPPIDWSTVLAPLESRAFVTFVHPAYHKGLMPFARLADMLGYRRPDIPVLVVQSGRSAGGLNEIPGIDFSRYPQIMAAPSTASPAEYFALTRILLVPSVWDEPFGRVAAESMINAIPPVVSNRGALPHVVGGDFGAGGGGVVLPLPDWLTPETRRVPSEQEIEPWYDAVCSLWDAPSVYDALASRARQFAEERFSEAVSRRRHVDYFTSLRPGKSPVGTRAFAAAFVSGLEPEVRHGLSKLRNWGYRYQCPFCRSHLRKFLPLGLEFPVLDTHRVIGGGVRSNGLCPICHSTDRERLLYLFLRHRTDVFERQTRLLHLAPEPQLSKILADRPNIDYLTGDLHSSDVMVQMNVTRIEFPDETFNAILCSHVLEHVPDDRLAMRELCRVLQRGGWAILQVPISLRLEHTFEDFSITTSAGREAAFGQHDHVRIYARDYEDRLRESGFVVRVVNWTSDSKDFGGRRNVYGLNPEESVYLASKP